MDSLPMEKFNGNNFHKWKVKVQMHLMNISLWSIVKGTEQDSTNPILLVEWEKKEENDKSIIGLSL